MKTKTFSKLVFAGIAIIFIFSLAGALFFVSDANVELKSKVVLATLAMVMVVAVSGYLLFMRIVMHALSEREYVGNDIELEFRLIVYDFLNKLSSHDSTDEDFKKINRLVAVTGVLVLLVVFVVVGYFLAQSFPTFIEIISRGPL